MKTMGIIVATIVVSLGLIVSIVFFYLYRVKEHPTVINNTQPKNINTANEKKDPIKEVTSLHTFKCEVVEVANEENKFHQIGCEDGSKDGFTDTDIVGKHSKLKVGDTVVVTRSKDGILNVRIETE